MTTYFKPENTVKVPDGAYDSLPHVQKRFLQETLYRDTIARTKLRSERVASPEARPVKAGRHQQQPLKGDEAIKTHAIVEAASF
jgi:hypothetical protein